MKTNRFQCYLVTFLVGIYGIGQNCSAREIILATITRDDSQSISQLVINTSDDDRVINEIYKDDFHGTTKISRDQFDIEQFSKTGIVLEKKDKYNILILKSENFDQEQGGMVTIDSLYNGVNGKRKQYQLNLAKGKSGWGLDQDGKEIKNFHIQINKIVIVGTVGIKNIKMN